MHPEFRAYRSAVADLLRAVPEPVHGLMRRSPELALARETLLEADLVEAERHVSLVEPLVGAGRSIAQRADAQDNAVSLLRRIRHHRAALFAPFMRHHDLPVSSTQ
jgi:hypothetical protein